MTLDIPSTSNQPTNRFATDTSSSDSSASFSPISTTASFSNGTSADQPTNKKPISSKMMIGLAALVLTIIGAGAGLLLTQTNQDPRQQASGDPYAIGVCCINGVTVPGVPAAECRAEAEQGGNATIGVCGGGGNEFVLEKRFIIVEE